MTTDPSLATLSAYGPGANEISRGKAGIACRAEGGKVLVAISPKNGWRDEVLILDPKTAGLVIRDLGRARAAALKAGKP